MPTPPPQPAGPPLGNAGPARAAGPAGPGCTASSLRALIETHRPADRREELSHERFLAELARLARPCDEDADLVHATASAVVAGPRGTVLHRHRRLKRWMQPGGHIDPGEQPHETALRETVEETGLAVAHPPGGPLLVHLDVHPAAEGHTHLDVRYLLHAADQEPCPAPGESPEVAWFSWEDAARMADESLAGALAAARRVLPAAGAGHLREER